MQLFDPGQVHVTPGVVSLVGKRLGLEDIEETWTIALSLTQTLAIPLVLKHSQGDWGKVDPEDKKTNDEAVKLGNRILSAYEVAGGTVWVITEADRSVTTLLLPEEY